MVNHWSGAAQLHDSHNRIYCRHEDAILPNVSEFLCENKTAYVQEFQ